MREQITRYFFGEGRRVESFQTYELLPATLEQLIDLDEFTQNKGWSEFDDREASTQIKAGKFIVESRLTGHTWKTSRAVLIDTTRNFSIETEMKWIGGYDDNFYGVLWGSRDGNNFFFFGVTSSGNFAYRKFLNGSWTDVIRFRLSLAINKGVASNKLFISKRGENYEFRINDQVVGIAPSEDFTGNIGFHLNDPMKVEIEYLRIRYE